MDFTQGRVHWSAQFIVNKSLESRKQAAEESSIILGPSSHLG